MTNANNNRTVLSVSPSQESLPATAPRRQRIAGAGRTPRSAPPCREHRSARHHHPWRALRLALASALIGGVVCTVGAPAFAETLGYPNAGATPYRPTTVKGQYWVDENGDGRKQIPAELVSSRGYAYRSGIDFVAWQLQTLGVSDTTTRGLWTANDWATVAPQRAGVAVRNTPVRFGVAVNPTSPGQVAFVEDVLADGRVTVVEYDAQGTGVGRMWTGAPGTRGFTKYLDFGLSVGRTPGSPIAIARNADGRLELFGVTTNGITLHKWQWSAGGTWTDWAPFGGNFTAIAAETNADGRIEVFAVAADGAISHKWQVTVGSAWSRWTKIAGGLDTITMARSFDGRLVAFGTNSRQGIYRTTELAANGAWSAWAPFGSGLTDVAAQTNADGRMEVFGIARNGAISHTWENSPAGTWSTWSRMEGRLDRIALTRSYDGRLVAFGTNTTRGIYVKSQLSAGAAWSAWTPFGGGLVDITAATNADGRIEVFGVATNGVVSHRWQTTPNGPWSPWTKIADSLRP